MSNQTTEGRSGLLIGGALVIFGALFLLAPVLGINMRALIWPFFIIGPGVLFFLGMVLGGKSAGPLAVPGSVVTSVGLILLTQATAQQIAPNSGAFATWAYAWALIFPTSVGIGLIINGVWSDEEGLVRTGTRLTTIGLVIFLIAGVFFEVLLDLTDNPFTDVLWPLMLIGLGFYLLRGRISGGKSSPSPTLPPAKAKSAELTPPSEAKEKPVEFEPLREAEKAKTEIAE